MSNQRVEPIESTVASEKRDEVSSSETPRTRLQFGMRRFLIGVTALTLVAIWFAGRVNDERMRREILGIGESHRELARAKGQLHWLPDLLDVDATAAWIDGHAAAPTSCTVTIRRNASPKALQNVARLFPRAVKANVPTQLLTSQVASQLVVMPMCRFIRIHGGRERGAIAVDALATLRPALPRCEFEGVAVDDDLLVALADAQWQGQFLENCRWTVGPRGLNAVARLPELRMLALDGPDLTDESLEALAEHPGLRTIVLYAPQVTDAGLARLARIPNLNWLAVNASKNGAVGVTEEGCEALRAATNRKLEVRHNAGHQWFGVPPLRAL